MVLPCVAILASLMIVPLVYELALSFHEWIWGSGLGWIFNWGLNYVKVLTDPRFATSLYNTLIIGGSSLALEFAIGFTLAFSVEQKNQRSERACCHILFADDVDTCYGRSSMAYDVLSGFRAHRSYRKSSVGIFHLLA